MRFNLLAATALTTTIAFLVPGVGFAQSAYDWSGPYVGVTTGVIYSDSPIVIDGDEDVPIYSTGALLGVTAGYNLNMDGVVVGIEGDASFANVHGERSSFGSELEADLDGLLTLRGRLGYASGQALFYGTAGLAVGHARFSAYLPQGILDPLVPAQAEGFVAGVTGGAGIEYALTDNLSIKSEGLIYQTASLSAVGNNGKGEFDADYAPGGVAVRTGLNLDF